MARSIAELQSILAAYEGARDDILVNRVSEVEIGEEHFTMLNIATLEKEIDKYAAMVNRATARAAGRTGFSVVRFGRPT